MTTEQAITASDFASWAYTAKPGDKIVYRVGKAINYRGAPTDGVVYEVRKLFNTGALDLHQVLVGHDGAASVRKYVATMRRRPHRLFEKFPNFMLEG